MPEGVSGIVSIVLFSFHLSCVRRPGFNFLSIREMEIIQLIKQGFSSKEIASAKSISVKTVEVHRYNILKKLNLKNAAALVNLVNKYDLSMS